MSVGKSMVSFFFTYVAFHSDVCARGARFMMRSPNDASTSTLARRCMAASGERSAAGCRLMNGVVFVRMCDRGREARVGGAWRMRPKPRLRQAPGPLGHSQGDARILRTRGGAGPTAPPLPDPPRV